MAKNSMTEVKWDGPNTLQIDSWATHQQRALAMLHNNKITIEVTDGSSWWRAEIPAPWVKPCASAGGCAMCKGSGVADLPDPWGGVRGTCPDCHGSGTAGVLGATSPTP